MPDVIGAVALIGLAVVANAAMLAFQSLRLFNRVAQARVPRLVVGLLELAAFGLILLRMVVELAPTLIGWGVPGMHRAWFIEIAAFRGSDQITFIATLIVLTLQGMRLGYAGSKGSEEDARRRGSLLIAVMVVVVVLALLFMQFLVWPEARSLAALWEVFTWDSSRAPVVEGVLWFSFLTPILFTLPLLHRYSQEWPDRRPTARKHYTTLAVAYLAVASVFVTRAVLLVRLFRWAKRVVALVRRRGADGGVSGPEGDALGIAHAATPGTRLSRFNALFCCMTFAPLILLWTVVAAPFARTTTYPGGTVIAWCFTAIPLAFLVVEWLAQRSHSIVRLMFLPVCWCLLYGPFLFVPAWWRPSQLPYGLPLMEMVYDMTGSVLPVVLACTAVHTAVTIVCGIVGFVDSVDEKQPPFLTRFLTSGGLAAMPLAVGSSMFLPLFMLLIAVDPYWRLAESSGWEFKTGVSALCLGLSCMLYWLQPAYRNPDSDLARVVPRILRLRSTRIAFSLLGSFVAATPLYFHEHFGLTRVRPYLEQRRLAPLPFESDPGRRIHVFSADGAVVIAHGPKVGAIDAGTGNPLWHIVLSAFGDASTTDWDLFARWFHYPQVESLLLADRIGANAILLDTATGEIRWKWSRDEPSDSTRVPSERKVLANADGCLLWPDDGDGYVFSAGFGELPALPQDSDDPPVRLQQLDTSFLVVTASRVHEWNGKKWVSTKLPPEVTGCLPKGFTDHDQVFLWNGTLILPTLEAVFWLDRQTLEVRYRLDNDPYTLLTAAAVVENHLVLETWRRSSDTDIVGVPELTAIGLESRRKVWRRPLGMAADLVAHLSRRIEGMRGLVPVGNSRLVFVESGPLAPRMPVMVDAATGELLWRRFALQGFGGCRFSISPCGYFVRQSDTHLVAYDIRTGERQFEHWFVSLDDPLRPPSVPAPQRNNRYPTTGIMFHEAKWLWCDVGGDIQVAKLPP